MDTIQDLLNEIIDDNNNEQHQILSNYNGELKTDIDTMIELLECYDSYLYAYDVLQLLMKDFDNIRTIIKHLDKIINTVTNSINRICILNLFNSYFIRCGNTKKIRELKTLLPLISFKYRDATVDLILRKKPCNDYKFLRSCYSINISSSTHNRIVFNNIDDYISICNLIYNNEDITKLFILNNNLDLT
jgi:hypothetical protein